ncbi:MAG: cupredoxin domain-containing protein [Chloroflexota bacterium]
MRRSAFATGISMAAIVLAGCSGAATPAPAQSQTPATNPPAGVCAVSSDAPGVTVTVVDFAFDPTPVTATVGQPIGWTNQDGAPHTATLDEGDCATGTLAAGGGTGSLVFSEPGTYPYHCAIHSRMKGSIVVTN